MFPGVTDFFNLNNQFLILALVIWELIWKGIGLWKASKNNQLYWFIAIFIVNTLGILPIIYLLLQRKGSFAYLKFFQKKTK